MDASTSAIAQVDGPAVIIIVVLFQGDTSTSVPARTGEQLLIPLRRAGLNLPAICGGKGACGTCRVHVTLAWRDRFDAPLRRETRLLAHTGASEGDRLSCLMTLEAWHDGLEVHKIIQEGNE